MNKKVLNNNSLNIVCEELRTNDKKIVLCHGCFDLLHIGHINYLKKAKSLGDILIVTVCEFAIKRLNSQLSMA